MVKAKATKKYRRSCGYQLLLAKPAWWRPCAIEIDVEYRCSKAAAGYAARDIQNAIAAMKAGIDALADIGIVPNDSKRWLRWGHFNLVTQLSPKGDGVTLFVRAQ